MLIATLLDDGDRNLEALVRLLRRAPVAHVVHAELQPIELRVRRGRVAPHVVRPARAQAAAGVRVRTHEKHIIAQRQQEHVAVHCGKFRPCRQADAKAAPDAVEAPIGGRAVGFVGAKVTISGHK